MQYYHSYDECLIIAIEKEKELTNEYTDHGNYVTDTKSDCEQYPLT